MAARATAARLWLGRPPPAAPATAMPHLEAAIDGPPACCCCICDALACFSARFLAASERATVATLFIPPPGCWAPATAISHRLLAADCCRSACILAAGDLAPDMPEVTLRPSAPDMTPSGDLTPCTRPDAATA